MDVKAEHRYAKISAFKVREVTREIQGLPAEAALEIVRLIPKKASRLIGKVLASAIANAENNNNLRATNLVVKEAIAGEGPTMKRMHTRARGGGARINKRTAHIRITLTEAEPLPQKEKKPRGIKKTKAVKPVVNEKHNSKEKEAQVLDTAAPAIAQHAAIEKHPDEGHSLAAGYHSEQVTSGESIEPQEPKK